MRNKQISWLQLKERTRSGTRILSKVNKKETKEAFAKMAFFMLHVRSDLRKGDTACKSKNRKKTKLSFG